uniref:Golgi apparatus protein 1 n=1 Tax=Syphacia muris TaxID=451379 RepID=A0A0N5ASS7_9BILA
MWQWKYFAFRPQNAGFQQAPQGAQNEEPKIMQKRLMDYPECQEDIHKFCTKGGIKLASELAIIECLQEVDFTERDKLSLQCENLLWQYKLNLTQEAHFGDAVRNVCASEVASNRNISQCLEDTRPGYAISCVIEHIQEIPRQDTQCFNFLAKTEMLAFSDYSVIGPFVDKCRNTVERLQCGMLTPMSAHQRARVAHSQGSTLECLIRKMIEKQKEPGADDPYGEKLLGAECRHEVMRIAELQTDDFHLDRDLFFACRQDREVFCSQVPSGGGKVFECLMEKRADPKMSPQCSKMLAERAQLMGQDFRLARPLVKACTKEMNEYQCNPRPEARVSPNYHLSWVLLCLENAHHLTNGTKFSEECKYEMMSYRTFMMSEFKMSPEMVLSCGKEINEFCSQTGDIERQGKTLHCLMAVAQSRDPKRQLGAQCKVALETVIKTADVGSDYRVDKILYASCRPLIEGPCANYLESPTSTLTCLMQHVDSKDMSKECEKRLLEVQYFLARDWTLDPELYQACHFDAVNRCHASDHWHLQTNTDNRAEEGPIVLSCLYRNAYDEQNPLQPACADNIRRILRLRAARVFLMPDIEDTCREALSEYCSADTNPSSEMKCLQEHFQETDFKLKHESCYTKLAEFTAMEAKDTALNHALTKECKPVISKYCQEFANEAIDHGDVMECLYNHKDAKEMNEICRSYVDHFELISLRDYRFSFHFNQSCAEDIQRYCRDEALSSDKSVFVVAVAQIIQCLSRILFEHKVLGTEKNLRPECKKQLKTAFLQQEQFDDMDHMEDVHKKLMHYCRTEIEKFNCLKNAKSFEDVIGCLRQNFAGLGSECQALIFDREKIEALDNEFDDELQKVCRMDIKSYCDGYPEDEVLKCLTNSKVIRILSPLCQKVVFERMQEQVQDIRLNIPLFEACQKEAEEHCAEDYKKIRDAKYERKMLDGVIIQCLRAKFTAGVTLSEKCKAEISNVIVESEFDVRLDPPLYHACKEIVIHQCKDHFIRRGFDIYEALECLKEEYRKGAIYDQNCKHEVARRLQEFLSDINLDPILNNACSHDLKVFCDGISPGKSRLIICLLDTLRSSKADLMTEECRKLLEIRSELSIKLQKDNLPNSIADLFSAVNSHPRRTSILAWFSGFILVLFFIGCCCGRASKRIRRELKNR